MVDSLYDAHRIVHHRGAAALRPGRFALFCRWFAVVHVRETPGTRDDGQTQVFARHRATAPRFFRFAADAGLWGAGYSQRHGHGRKSPSLFSKITMVRTILFILAGALVCRNADSFLSSALPRPTLPSLSTASLVASALGRLDLSAGDNESTAPEAVHLSDRHIATLRKEASKRLANKRMPVLFLTESETDGNFGESIADFSRALTANELIQVRGISRDSKKQIRNVADALAIALGVELGRDVNLVECKGHSGIYYCPASEDHPQKIKLHTSVGKKNQWKRKPKPARDNRGQIIPGLYE